MTQSNQSGYPTTTAPQLPTKLLNGGVTSMSEWEALLGAMDNGQMYDAIYGGPSFPSTEAPTSAAAAINYGGGGGGGGGDWSPVDASSWDLSAAASFSIGDLAANPASQGVPSISDESLSSGDDLTSSGDLYLSSMGGGVGGGGPGAGGGNDDYRNPLLQPPSQSAAAGGRSSQDGVSHLALDGLDLNNLGL